MDVAATRPTNRSRFARIAQIAVVNAAPRTGRRTRFARSRRAVIAGVLLFVSSQVGLNLAIRENVVPVRDPVFTEKNDFLAPHADYHQAVEPTAPVRVMALGSSRTQLGFDANRFQSQSPTPVSAFNFGCPAAGPITAALYFRRLLERGVQPDVLFVELHPGFLAKTDPPFEARWLHAYRLRPSEIDVLHSYGWDIPPPPHHGWKGWLASIHGYRMGLLNRYWPTMLACPFGLTVGIRSDDRGFVPGIEFPRHERPRALQRTRAEYAPVLADYHVGGAGCEAIRDVLALCAKNNIRAVAVLMPESSEFRGWYGTAGYAEIAAFAQSLGVLVFDTRTWVEDDDFADGHHLTARGATAFTDRLAKTWSEMPKAK